MALYDINRETLQQVTLELKPAGYECAGFELDVRNLKMVENVVKEIIDLFGTIDILVNNAGVTRDAKFFIK